MPKIKTKKIVVKRFKVTKNGKLLHRTQGMRHLRSRKAKDRQRRQDRGSQVLTAKYKEMVKSFFG